LNYFKNVLKDDSRRESRLQKLETFKSNSGILILAHTGFR